jgi:uncharacterized protein (DUF608 family)
MKGDREGEATSPEEAQRSFDDKATEAKFLLGGIGTGNVSINARGAFCDWEIFNRPYKGHTLPYSFFAVYVEEKSKDPVARVLEGPIPPPYTRAEGFGSGDVAGLPRLASSAMKGEYPFVTVRFEDPDLPVELSLEAFTPFIPLSADDSGIPAAVIRYRAKNRTNAPVNVTVAGSLANAIGFQGYDVYGYIRLPEGGSNRYRVEEGVRGLLFTNPQLDDNHLFKGSLALMSRAGAVTHKACWLEGAWFDGIHDFWDDFSTDGKLEPESEFDAPGSRHLVGRLKVGSLGIPASVMPGETEVFEFVLAWHFPNRTSGWKEGGDESRSGVVKNYYATLFADAWEAGDYLLKNLQRLEGGSRDFHRALFTSSLPWFVLDALASNITVIRSPTCFRIEDGTLLAWEGCNDEEGCCEGSCTHVWSYAQSLAFLFPELEHTMRRVEFNLETDDSGYMAFRSYRVFGQSRQKYHPAVDGQMGCLIRLYRDWKLSGNDVLLRSVWSKAVKALEFAFTYWDGDGDFVLDRQQHNTYDIEFYGPNTLSNTMFLAALKGASEMAAHLGDLHRARRYEEAFQKGSQRLDELLWDGDYYIQELDDVDKYRYQYGSGCLADQLLGQFHAHVTGLGHLLPEEHVRKAVKAIFDNNFKTSFVDHHNVQRTFVLNEERGLVLCSWPKGGRPRLPFVYCDEVWTGIEYQVAAHLIYEGWMDEGLTLVKAVRERHDGFRRNPWSEIECGHHYARSLSSWALLLALSGFQYDLVKGRISFEPRINREHFSTFWSTARAWGIYRESRDPDSGERSFEMEVLYGDLDGVRVNDRNP